MFENAMWIGPAEDMGEICPRFKKCFTADKPVSRAELAVTAVGVYEAELNGERVGDFILAPGLTSYKTRLQYQVYDVTSMLRGKNELTVTVGGGWHRGRISASSPDIHNAPCAIIAQISLYYADGSSQIIPTDTSWLFAKSRILMSDIYDGEIYDASEREDSFKNAVNIDLSKTRMIPQEGEYVREHERIGAAKYIVTPKGERVIDFGQNFAGYPEFTVRASKGDKVRLSFAEILDHDGNFYNDNYRSAEAVLEYTCRDGAQTFKPHFTFYGCRYIRIDEYPGEIDPSDFYGIALYSDMERSGNISFSHSGLNRLFSNTLWSQRSNFIDVPTDCPQRDERMGWTGDAQMFCKTASYNFNVYKFFSKWLADIRAEQRADGSVPDTVPNFWQLKGASAAWGDVICVVPWRMYLMYGDKKILADNFSAMKKWVGYITDDTNEKYLWTCPREEKGLWKKHYGDWLALDAPYGSYKGATDDDFIASAFYAYSVSIVIKAGEALGEEVSYYKSLYSNIKAAFKKRFAVLTTQTEHVLAIVFDLCDDKQAAADHLAEMIAENGNKLKTGFVGTPYLMYALSENGHADTAYKLLLQEEYPSWLYEVNHGATTIWEHWDGIRDDGKLWSTDMNSYNHYAYGAVIDWIYSAAAGINPDEKHPGFERALICPRPYAGAGRIDASYRTAYGTIRSCWEYTGSGFRYEISTPVDARIIIGGKAYDSKPGSYVFFSEA